MRQTLKTAVLAAAPFMLAACGGGGDGPAAPAPSSAPAAGAPVTALTVTLPPAPVLPAAAIPPGSGTFTCRGVRIGAIDLDTVVVPAGALCVLDGTALRGSLQVESGAVVDARNLRATGSVQAQGAAAVLIGGNSTIGGSVQLAQGDRATLLNAQVAGDIQITAQRGAVLVQDNRVGGNVQLEDNRGGVTVNTNVATGNLQCKQNLPPPIGTGNRAAQLQDQCAQLTAPSGPANPGVPTPPVTPPPQLPPPATPPQPGGSFTCSNVALGAIAIDTVVVPANARCTLTGTRLIGSVIVEPGAALDARDAVIGGNLQAERAARVALTGASRVTGSVQLVQSGPVTVDGAQVTGDIQATANSGLVWLQNTRVGGNVQINENRGGALLFDNRIVGNLQCGQNQPAPDGRGNSAALKEGQCVGL